MAEKIEHTALMSSAGAGKTRALTKRFLYLYLDKADYQLKSLYGITFTNEAAFEMKTRVLDYLDLLIAGSSNDRAKADIIDHFRNWM
jgi:ATP-dependent exoDNAse (exonuclease V) beta subunit